MNVFKIEAADGRISHQTSSTIQQIAAAVHHPPIQGKPIFFSVEQTVKCGDFISSEYVFVEDSQFSIDIRMWKMNSEVFSRLAALYVL